MAESYSRSVAQLFLHASLNKTDFNDYIFKELLIQKLNSLTIDTEEELQYFHNSKIETPTLTSRLIHLFSGIPQDAKFGIYCHCLQLGIVSLLDDPTNEFFLLLRVGMGISFEKELELKKLFSEMMLTFFGYSDE